MSADVLSMNFQAEAIRRVYLAVLEQCGIDEKVFLLMVVKSNAVQAVKSLLAPGKAQVGFRGLKKMGRADLSVEHLVIQPQWRRLFTEAERRVAKQRLERNTARKSVIPPGECDAEDDCPLHRRKSRETLHR
jgi:hypothetical protein